MVSRHLFLPLFVTVLCILPNRGNDESCPREAKVKSRDCLKRCVKDADCVSQKKKCMCDGICGMSCVKPNTRCKNLNKRITNGNVDIFPFNQFGAVAKYTCADGYVLYGVPARVCQGDKNWSGEEPRCMLNQNIEINECKEPPEVHHAGHDGSPEQKTFPLGHMLQYKCKDGFTARRESVDRAWCVGGGVWVGPNMTCTHAGCPLLQPIDFGRVEIFPPNMIGTKARYSCLPGYHLAGRAERTCQADGTWGGKEPSCERVVCGIPPKINHANHNALRGQERFPAGTELAYSCEFGFYPDGYQRAMCKGDGTWSGPRMTCSARNCGFPGEIANGWRDGSKFSYPAKVTYHCNEGYELIGIASRECQANGDWSSTLAICRPIECPEIRAPRNGELLGSGITYGTVLKFSCQEGFKVIGSVERKCEADGGWTGQEIFCEEINCGYPGPLWNGYLDGHLTTVGEVFFFRCNVRTTFDGPSFSTECQESGSWSFVPPKCLGQCQVPSILNGSVLNGREGVWVDHTTFIQFKCKDGLVLNDTSDVKCINGTWSLIPRCIPAPCIASPPSIENGRRVYVGWKHGDRARYMCLQGYRLRGDHYLTCRYGQWEGSRPYCEEVYCPNPGKLKYGKIYKKGHVGKFEVMSYIVTIKHGDRLEYECNRSYKLLGPSGATCVDGEWSPDQKPICVLGQHPILHKLWKPLEEQAV